MKVWIEPVDKPYYTCLRCPRFRDVCGGRPTRDLTLQEWCEYIRDVMYVNHLSNDYVAQKADVSKKTMESITALNREQDIMRGTQRRIEQVVLGPVGEFTCYGKFDHKAEARIAQLEETIAELRNELIRERKDKDRMAKIIDKYLEN